MQNVNITVTVSQPDSFPSDLFYQRSIDDLGRVVLPADYRRALEIGERDAVTIHLDRERHCLLLKKVAKQTPPPKTVITETPASSAEGQTPQNDIPVI